MAVTFGFYNSVRGDRVYNAEQMSSIFSGIIQDGVFENFPEDGQHLVCSKGTGLTMIVGPGRAWFNDTWTNNDSPLSLTFDAPDNQNDRIDTIALEINKTNSPHTVNAGSSTYIVEGRSNKFVVVKGTPAANPVRATLIRANGIYQYPIAIVRISPRTPNNIKSFDNVVGVSSYTPFIIGAVQSVSSENVLNAWKDEVDQKIQNDLDAYLQDDGSKLYEKLEPLVRTGATFTVNFSLANNVPSCNVERSEILDAINNGRPVKFVLIRHVSARESHTYTSYESVIAPSKIYVDFYDIDEQKVYRLGYKNEIDPDTATMTIRLYNETFSMNPRRNVFEVYFEIGQNDTPSCSSTFAEIRSALRNGKTIEVYFRDRSHSVVTGPVVSTFTRNTDGDLTSLRSSFSDIQPNGTNVEDWGWSCEGYDYSPTGLTRWANYQ